MKANFYIPIYDVTVDVIVLGKPKKLNKINNVLLDYLGLPEEEEFAASARFYPGYSEDGKCICTMVFDKHQLSVGLLVHEITHLVCYIGKLRDFKLDDSSEECFAYLFEYIMDELYKIVKNNVN